MPTPHEQESSITPGSLTALLHGLHEKHPHLSGGGEFIFREARSEAAVQNNSGWARAEFRGGFLYRVTYVKPVEELCGVPRVDSVTYLPFSEPSEAFVQTTQFVSADDILFHESVYVANQNAASEEIAMFILKSVDAKNYDFSPEYSPVSYAHYRRSAHAERWQQVAARARHAGLFVLHMIGATSGARFVAGTFHSMPPKE